VTLSEKMDLIEKAYGGAGQAAEAAGVTPTSWSRWKLSEKEHHLKPEERRGIVPSGPRLILIDLLYEQALSKKAS